MKNFIICITTGFYSGYSPVASGTAGSAVGVLIYLLISSFDPVFYALLTFFVCILGIWASTKAEDIFGEKDSGKIVIDEICGMLITMFLLPFTWIHILFGFLVFRAVDIIKPFRQVEELKGGWGVMLDDVIAGIFSNLIMHGATFLLN